MRRPLGCDGLIQEAVRLTVEVVAGPAKLSEQLKGADGTTSERYCEESFNERVQELNTLYKYNLYVLDSFVANTPEVVS